MRVGRVRVGAAAAVVAALLVLPYAGARGAALVDGDGAGDAPSPSAAVAPAPAAAGPRPPVVTAPPPTTDAAPVAAPVRVSVPSVGIDVEVVALGLEPDGSMQVPSDFAVAGWYADGPEPGEPGAAVVAGHVDSYEGPAAFFPLRHVEPGALIVVATADGQRLDFVVEKVTQHPKTAFPTDAVFAPTTGPTLRLVTCGGSFDRAARSYLDNLIVFARLLPPAAA